MEVDSSVDIIPEETTKQMIDGLLAETRIPDSFSEKVQAWLKDFQTCVKKLKPFSTESAKLAKHLSRIFPKQINCEDVGPEFLWKKPTSVTLMGSMALNCGVLRASAVDVLLEIPQDCLHRSDYLNHKYHVKRAFYFLALAEKLKTKGYENLVLSCPLGDCIKPILEVQGDGFSVRLHCSPPEDFFKPSRLFPDKNNVRFNHFYGSNLLSEEDSCSVGTPHYNFSISQDAFAKANNEFLQQHLSSRPVREAVILLKVWLKQRGLLEGYGSFSGFLVSMFIAYLIEKKQIYHGMSTYHVMKAVLHHLSSSSWDKDGIAFSTDDENISQWHQHNEVVFLDSTGVQNFTCHMSKLTYLRIKREASEALKTLQTGTVLSFQATFMRQVQFLSSFDHILQLVNIGPLEEELKQREELRWAVLNHSGNYYPVIASLLGSIIEKAVGNRVDQIAIELPAVKTVKLNGPSKSVKSGIRFGLTIKREAAMKQVEKCESEDPDAVAEFKDFWGEIAELRRFRDGSMAEAVVFSENKQRVCYEMLKYAINHHLQVELGSSVTSYLDLQIYSLFDPEFVQKPPEVIYAENTKKHRKRKAEQAETVRINVDEITTSASSSFERLSKALRQLQGLPLSITSVQCISPVYRYSHPFPTPPQRFFMSELLLQQNAQVKTSALLKVPSDGKFEKVPKLVEPVSVLVQLETTNKWPDNLRAVERLKCALLINVGQSLRSQYGLTVQAGPQYLDVLLDGFIFRVRLFYGRELILLKEVRDADGVIKMKDNAESYDLEKEGIQLPRLSSTLHSFQHQFEPFGKVCRLAKRWLASHLMLESPFNFKTRWGGGSTFTEESVELLVASLFLNHFPYPAPPNEVQTGFLRFLELLARTDWKITPLIVNFNQALTPEDVLNIERDFAKRREVFPALFIATPQDKQVSYWTRNVHKIILKRVALLADTALKYLSSQLSSEFSTEQDLRSSLGKVFSSSRDHFDAIIWLRKNMNAKSYQNIHSHPVPQLQFRKYDKSVDEFLPVVDFDPVRLYVEELRDNYGHLAMFFYDVYGGNFVAVVWKPDVLKPKDFSVSNVKGRRLAENEKVEVNVESVLQAFEVLGEGIVERVEAKSENWKT